jgi:hypothetical protein
MFGLETIGETVGETVAAAAPVPVMDLPPDVEAEDFSLDEDPHAAHFELAYGHYAEDSPDGAPAVDQISELTPEEQTAELGDMADEQFERVLDQVPAGDQAKLETLISNCEDPKRKLLLWQRYHNTINKREIDEAAPEEEVGEDPDAMAERVRREEIVRTTETEIEDDITALEESGEELTLDQVDELIRRKELESDIEMKHGINVTTAGGTRANGTRIIWTEEQLAVMRDSLDQLPASIINDRKVLSEIRRDDENEAGDNGVNDPNGGVITMFDKGTTMDTTTEPLKREMGDPVLDEDITWMEQVLMHEIGHSVHNQNLDKHLPVFDQATEHKEGSQHAEYFSEHFKYAMLTPEYYAKFALDEKQAEHDAAVKALAKNPNDPALQEAAAFAKKNMDGYKAMHTHMREKVFHTHKYEEAYAAQLSEDDAKDFRERAARLSTPEQLGRLAEEYALDPIDRDELDENGEMRP